MTVCMYRDIHTLQPYITDFTQRGCHTLKYRKICYVLHVIIVSKTKLQLQLLR